MYNMDNLEYMNGKHHDGITMVLGDPPYEPVGAYDKNISEIIDRFAGKNIVLFCNPKNQYGIGGLVSEYLFWVKPQRTMNYMKQCGKFVEMILVIRGNTSSAFNLLHWSQMTGIYNDKPIYSLVHPHQKPISLIERLLLIYSNPGDVVFDPFMGSGTTAVACKRLGRSFVGCETDSNFYQIARERVESEKTLTG
jgi:hypothetical protein